MFDCVQIRFSCPAEGGLAGEKRDELFVLFVVKPDKGM